MRCFLFYVFFCFNAVLYSQSISLCGTDLMMKRYTDKHGIKKANPQIIKKNTNNQSLDTKIIPLVFHIIHEGQPIGLDENVSVDRSSFATYD